MKLRGLIPNFHIHVSVSNFYIFPRSVSLFCCIAFTDQSWDYINHSQIHEGRNWAGGCAVPFLGICVSNFRDKAFAVLGLEAVLQDRAKD
jgi:hypothetical protein